MPRAGAARARPGDCTGAGAGALVLRTVVRRGWPLWGQVGLGLAGAVPVFLITLGVSERLFDLLYPFVPSDVPEGVGLLALVFVIGDVGGALRTLNWAIGAAYGSGIAWSLGAGLMLWRHKGP